MSPLTLDTYQLYRTARNRLLELEPEAMTMKYRTRISTFRGATDDDWRILEPLLAGLDALYAEMDYDAPGVEYVQPSTFGRVARVEFIHTRDQYDVERRGALVFDNRWEPLLHVENALLGYGGSGPDLSRRILTAVGVSEELFHQANSAVKSHNYDSLVFSREETYVSEGEELVRLSRPPLAEWSWWITS